MSCNVLIEIKLAQKAEFPDHMILVRLIKNIPTENQRLQIVHRIHAVAMIASTCDIT